MTSRDFAYWLQGHFELNPEGGLNERQTDLVRRHLKMVFLHEIDPSMPDPDGKLLDAHTSPPDLGLTSPSQTHQHFGPPQLGHGDGRLRC